ncbi:MAG: CDP-alcohol phosphatidyltransferase family protein [Clostridia bacterium]|nr:CDP-alcohol phosphatidyltransferase family protein [Clostridia bacterium]
MKNKLLGVYDYTVILTYAALVFGVFGILSAINLDFWNSVICLMLAGICDMFDGAVARTKVDRTDAEKRFGIQIDSLADLVNFGVLPAIFVYMICDESVVISIVAVLFVLCALIRLSYFNVLEEERQRQTTGKRKSYLGLPVTSAALILPLVYLMFDYRMIKNTAIFPIMLVLLGSGYISTFHIKKPGVVGKIIVVIIGAVEAVGMFFVMGWDAV